MDLSESFQTLQVGDIFHACYDGVGKHTGSAICLVTHVDKDTITARTVTTQWQLIFDRKTLIGQCGDGEKPFVVDSTKKLPDNVYNIMLELDWKFNPTNPIREGKLTRAQIDALLFLSTHYRT